MHWVLELNPKKQRLVITRRCLVGEVGFEPTQAEADDFTDRSF